MTREIRQVTSVDGLVEVDEVVADNVKLFHIEKMSEKYFWFALYFENEGYAAFNVGLDKDGNCFLSVMEHSEGFDVKRDGKIVGPLGGVSGE